MYFAGKKYQNLWATIEIKNAYRVNIVEIKLN